MSLMLNAMSTSLVARTRREQRRFAIAGARDKQNGVTFRPGVVHVRFFRRDDTPWDVACGFINLKDRPIQIYVAVDQSDEEVIRTCLHELKHAADLLALG